MTPPASRGLLRGLVARFSPADAQAIKDIEKTTNHDVKAVEYWIKSKFKDRPELEKYAEFVHFACTSEDINNTSHALQIKHARAQVLLPGLASHPVFFAGAFEKFGVGVQVTRVGKYKSAIEPYTRKDMSPENREQLQKLLDDIWGEYVAPPLMYGVRLRYAYFITCTNVIKDDQGEIIEAAPAVEFFANPRHARTQAFLRSML